MKILLFQQSYWGTERALLPIKAVLFPVGDFHFLLVDSSGLHQVTGKMRRMVLNLIQNASGDVIFVF